jgi:hypothetical protein
MQTSQTRTWRLIWLTVISALICWLASVMMLRALAQTAQTAQTAEPVETNEAESTQRRAPPPKISDEESPEYRDSADNNISLPVDI